MKKFWAVRSVEVPPLLTSPMTWPKAMSEFLDLLAADWEPYAVTQWSNGTLVHHLRKKVR